MKRYHPLLVSIHWIVALMVLLALLVGGPALAELENSDPDKIFALAGHMIWGIVIGTLMIIRLITRFSTQTPPEADAGHAMLNFGAKLAHWGLYLLIFGMVGSGLGLALSADLFAISFGSSAATLPLDFKDLTARQAHGLIANLLLLLVALHLLGWAYHQFIRKDHLFRRMWFGKRAE
ncbi:cytochrome b561 [Aliiroseovarius halocynthiae]|uniref:Cytochrome b n=1 Tax=Aliiroseovarius halocynthiae TaxID=985055 RepID=A0A545SWK2_9RHOB|nr:cytochrome b/b6 domain-containing protein [Aliiroseovarius halocynthiae]TQV69330.1 cytochrome b [Aliiroseovarius halocynthiae]SMR72153.1 cytochrome b561 [Aliiroseovarius halocynthiae]